MKKLSDTQKKILTAASKQPQLSIEEHMARYKSPAVRRQIAYSLLCSGYVTEDADCHYITEEGIAAVSAKGKKAAKATVSNTEPEDEQDSETNAPAESTAASESEDEENAETETQAQAPAEEESEPEQNSETATAEAPAADTGKPAKGRQLLINMLLRDDGATTQQMVDASGWQSGAIAGTLSKIKKLIAPQGQVITSSKGENGKLVYKIVKQAA